jgi:hypothetical protein
MTDEYHAITTGLEYCDNEIDRHTRLIEEDDVDMIILKEELTHYEIGPAHKETRDQMRLLELNIQIHKNKIKLIEIMKLVYIEINLVYTSNKQPQKSRSVYQKVQDQFEIQWSKIRILLRKQYAMLAERDCEMPNYDPKKDHEFFLILLDELKKYQTKMETICRLGECFADRHHNALTKGL